MKTVIVTSFDKNYVIPSQVSLRSLSDNYHGKDKIKIKCDGQYMDIGLLEDERFWIMTKYPIDKDKELPRLSETEIAKILNKK